MVWLNKMNHIIKTNKNLKLSSGVRYISTSDKLIRTALKKELEQKYTTDPCTKIIEELGILHGASRIDIAVINGLIHGYELKSDVDSLTRLPEQIKIYNSVLDKITLVVGKKHLYKAFKLVPEWWGITIAKASNVGLISFYHIRNAEKNPNQDNMAIASLLWRNEALDILEEMGQAHGVRSKTKKEIYKRLAEVLDGQILKISVRNYLCSRVNWRSDLLCTPDDG